ncbi:hypothetical protein [Candidatus Poriferisodalis sp.]|uniref:hypothetical protein n=1 Tax=Candidatus Poriferisodalis sp. TaxID=3101277 RepID=UPI003B015217
MATDELRRTQLYQYIWASPMFNRWHWLQWNFDQLRATGVEATSAARIVDALLTCNRRMPGFAFDMVDRVAAVGGDDRNRDHYEAIRQWLAELLVVNHFVTWPWPFDVSMTHERDIAGVEPKPEMLIEGEQIRLGIEVKCPDLRSHGAARSSSDMQLLARVAPSPAAAFGDATLPRDNPVKDALVSSERKFVKYCEDPAFRSLLVIVWDDYINEPITALLSPASGLLTENSFARDSNGDPLRFGHTDAVVVLRHQHQFVQGLKNKPPLDQRTHLLDYGRVGRFPPNALIINPSGRTLSRHIVDATQATEPDERLGGEYVPGEIVLWFDVEG